MSVKLPDRLFERVRTAIQEADEYIGKLETDNERLRVDAEDAKADALRLHRDKMNYFEAALALVHSETIKSVCGWYPEIEAFRKLVGANSSSTPTKERS